MAMVAESGEKNEGSFSHNYDIITTTGSYKDARQKKYIYGINEEVKSLERKTSNHYNEFHINSLRGKSFHVAMEFPFVREYFKWNLTLFYVEIFSEISYTL